MSDNIVYTNCILTQHDCGVFRLSYYMFGLVSD